MQKKGIAVSDKPNITVESFESRYGGYWRFPEYLDFCYLVNPFFPNETLLNRIKNKSGILLSNYPSNSDINNENAAKLLGVGKKYVVLGNGASELIRAASKFMTGKVFIPIPTFNEYLDCFRPHGLIPFSTRGGGYRYSADELIGASEPAASVILINPDNPSGNFIDCDQMAKLLKATKHRNQTLIVDESFVDFSEKERKFTLINDGILKSNPHLIVIKSISKSYGVPGARLGVAASGDTRFIETLQKELPIWNINSFGEYFLQIAPKYKNEYKAACESLAFERKIFFSRLGEIPGIIPAPSQANYLLVRLLETNAGKLTEALLANNKIFIKNLKGKTGFEKDEYIRIAVRTREENEKLANALETILK